MLLCDRKSELPVKRQIYEEFKQRMLCGDLKAGEAMPSTRALAETLAVSRSTVCEAYDMLLAEGFIVVHQGAPTRVAPGLTVDSTPQRHDSDAAEPQRRFAADFKTGQPDLREFARFAFEQSIKKAASGLSADTLGYTGPQGLPALRAQISAYLWRSRGIKASVSDIFITAGATHALHVAAQVLRPMSQTMIMEDPCHIGMRKTFEREGFLPIPIPVDEAGLMTDMLVPNHGCCVYVTPSHQFPLGSILSASRRAALIRFARNNESYIIEDDYDSEFRYAGEPIAPLYAMDPQRVIYVGTFSKVLYPALRIGFVILPAALQEPWVRARTYTDVQNPVLEQAALADFFETRRLDRHIQKMRRLYGARRRTLLNSLSEVFADAWQPLGDAAGLHMAVRFNGMRFEDHAQALLRDWGIRVAAVSRHCIEKGRHDDMLLLGYGHLNDDEIKNGVKLLGTAIRRLKDT